MNQRIVVAMSGGVDSSVAAALLCEQGFEVIGVTLQLWGKDVCVSSGTKLCCSVRDSLDAREVARRLGIHHETLELADVFRARVIDYFIESYRKGLTPNPCIACNDHIKFGSLLDYAKKIKALFVASGHYARVGFDDARNRFILLQASDAAKDQSYVLFNLTQEQLRCVKFPLGELSKEEVRRIARSHHFVTAGKAESQDICFVRDRDKNGFLRLELQAEDTPGPIADSKGNVLGMHSGLLGYTIGQREGIGIACERPLYVLKLDTEKNRLIVGEREELLQHALVAERTNWVSIDGPSEPIRCQVKIRSRHKRSDAWAIPLEGGCARVEFDEPQSAITPGQAAVFYDGDILLGGGWISSELDETWRHETGDMRRGELEKKLLMVKSCLRKFERVIVAFSGGVDSTLLAKLARDVLGKEQVLAITGNSSSLGRQDLEYAKRLAKQLDLTHEVIETDELSDPTYRSNSGLRCYACKEELFRKCEKLASRHGACVILFGAIGDDEATDRPGERAAAEYGARAPLKEVGLTKNEVRKLAKQLGLPNCDRPQNACLASRIPYGCKVTEEKLRQIDAAEKFLCAREFRQVRVRHKGAHARIEVDREQVARFNDASLKDELIKAFKEFGFSSISFDRNGYCPGGANRDPAEEVFL